MKVNWPSASICDRNTTPLDWNIRSRIESIDVFSVVYGKNSVCNKMELEFK